MGWLLTYRLRVLAVTSLQILYVSVLGVLATYLQEQGVKYTQLYRHSYSYFVLVPYRDKTGRTPLFFACGKQKNTELVRILLDKNAEANPDLVEEDSDHDMVWLCVAMYSDSKFQQLAQHNINYTNNLPISC